jgi:tetratricopeptide (TPR) repeat protein
MEKLTSDRPNTSQESELLLNCHPIVTEIADEPITAYLIQSTVDEVGVVRVWAEDILLPTYEIGEEEKNPIFLEKRVYQGSSGSVYPYAVVEKISDVKKDKLYRALFIENRYIKVMILPELGGRIHMAFDKVKQRHFVYYNQVIKPALVGLTGPWISGGIEFNWPQHHRPSTFLPTDYSIEENADGSKTVWCNEVERMFRTKGMQGFTLHPDKAYIEIKVKIYNRTAFPQTFLWWANPAVVVNDGYKSVFPPDVNFVFDHGKRDVSNFPIATGEYYKQDYSAGVDISKYKNIPVPTSYMAVHSKYNFVGGYEDDVQAGLLHVANHHISPGKKQWTWGNGDFGLAWDRNLTDKDGPYIELMTGVFTDNQPDFSWLQAYEEKSWVQYFMPYAEVGYVKNATKDAIINIEVDGNKVDLILYTTSLFENLKLELKDIDGIILYHEIVTVSPYHPYKKNVIIGDVVSENLIFTIYTADDKVLVAYQEEKPEIKLAPDPAKAALDPKEIISIEQLFLTGLHLEQYRHATYNPLDYYLEALSRDSKDVRCNNAIGLLMLRRGQFEKAEAYFRTAVEVLTERSPNPYDGEPHYNLGCCLKIQGRLEDAYTALYKSTWNATWQDAAFYALAQIDCIKGEWKEALERIDSCLIRNWHNHKARQLKTSILRKLGTIDEALVLANESIKIDRFNMGCRFEKYLLINNETEPSEMNTLMRKWSHGYIEYALDFAGAGLYDEAIQLLQECANEVDDVYPMVFYTIGYFESMKGDKNRAIEWYKKASLLPPEKCFPNRIEEVKILQDAILLNPNDAKAPYYLGNFWYAFRQYDNAIQCWESSVNSDDQFPTVLRNLALAYFNKTANKVRAQEVLEKAFVIDTTDSRIFMELDQLYKKIGKYPAERLVFFERYSNLVEERDDLCIERIGLYCQIGKYEIAKNMISTRKFHPWEGGEGKVTGLYTLCRVELAKIAIAEKRFPDAIQLLKETEVYPHNLGEGKLKNAEENEIYYYKGLAYQGRGDYENAKTNFRLATLGSPEPVQAFFYNDQQPDKIFYQGLAWRELGDEEKARSRFKKLVAHGEKYLFEKCRIDYFAVSLPDLAIWDDDLNIRNQVHCNYVMALGHSGLGNEDLSETFYKKVKELDINKHTFRK